MLPTRSHWFRFVASHAQFRFAFFQNHAGSSSQSTTGHPLASQSDGHASWTRVTPSSPTLFFLHFEPFFFARYSAQVAPFLVHVVESSHDSSLGCARATATASATRTARIVMLIRRAA